MLARAGRSVRVLEAKPTIGGGSRSAELTLPGFVHDDGGVHGMCGYFAAQAVLRVTSKRSPRGKARLRLSQ